MFILSKARLYRLVQDAYDLLVRQVQGLQFILHAEAREVLRLGINDAVDAVAAEARRRLLTRSEENGGRDE